MKIVCVDRKFIFLELQWDKRKKEKRKNMNWNHIRESYSKSISDYKKQSEHLYALIQLYNWLIKLMEGLSVLIS